MNLHHFTGLGRTLDPRLPTNLAIIVVTAVAGAASGLASLGANAGLTAAAASAAGAALAVFFAWAISREIDPDNPLSAFVSAGLALVALLLWPPHGLLVAVWVLLLTRLVGRTTGLPPTLLDAVGLVGLGLWLSREGQPAFALLTAIGLLLSSLLPGGRLRQRYIALLPLLGFLALLAIRGPFPGVTSPGAITLLAFGAPALGFAVLLPATEWARSRADATGERLSRPRVQAAQVLAAVGALTATLAAVPATSPPMPIWAALGGVTLYRLAMLARRALHQERAGRSP